MVAHPAATRQQAAKSRCPSRLREGSFGAVAIDLLGVMARVFGWRPDEFWTATPADLAAVLGRQEGAGGVDRAALTAMMEACPDG